MANVWVVTLWKENVQWTFAMSIGHLPSRIGCDIQLSGWYLTYSMKFVCVVIALGWQMSRWHLSSRHIYIYVYIYICPDDNSWVAFVSRVFVNNWYPNKIGIFIPSSFNITIMNSNREIVFDTSIELDILNKTFMEILTKMDMNRYFYSFEFQYPYLYISINTYIYIMNSSINYLWSP